MQGGCTGIIMISMIFGFMTMLIPDCRFWKGCLSAVRRRINYWGMRLKISWVLMVNELTMGSNGAPERHSASFLLILGRTHIIELFVRFKTASPPQGRRFSF